MKKVLDKVGVTLVLLVSSVACFGNVEVAQVDSFQDKAPISMQVVESHKAPISVQESGFQDKALINTQVVETQKEVVPVKEKPAYKNAALMERELKYTSGDGAVSLAQLIKDKKAVLLDFYTTWCGPCKDLMPELRETSEKLAPQGVSVVGINVDRNEKKAEGLRKANGINFPWLVEADDEMHSKHFQVNSYPRTVLLSQEGEVLFNGHPKDPVLQDALRKLGVSL